ncbi:MAG: hypothetical protein LBM69_07545, partial [Lachnospiraceae bacterium]|nr:hypothetical protein [Lachnospiraceae bacterium]
MEFLFLLILIVGAGCFALINGFLSVAREKKSFEQRLREQFGTIQAKKYDADRFERISGYYEKHEKPNQIDDITWNDLDMDEIYCRIDTTFSAVGEEYLYYLLRTPANKMPELESLERLITFFGQNERERIRVQILSRKLGHTGNFSLYDYLDFLEALELPGVWPAKIRNAAFIPMIALSFFSPVVGLCGILLLVIVGILTHMKGKGAIEPYFVSFGYILRLLEVNTLLCRESLPADIVDPEVFGKAIRHLSKLKRGAYWLGAGISTGGNPA